MLTRRACVLGLAAMPFAASAQPKLSDDGMYEFDWYLESFLDLKEDLVAATEAGKKLAVIISQRACPYCKRMAEEHFSTPAIVDYVRANFEVLHLNLFGAREVTDLAGKKMSERDFSRQQGVRATPTILFYAQQREVARMPGLLEPQPFLAMFRYVKEEAYLRQSFTDWMKTQG